LSSGVIVEIVLSVFGFAVLVVVGILIILKENPKNGS
jgi:hypothetical protein